jgi:hypothetical protein
MTRSQLTAWIAATALALTEVGQKLVPLSAVLPPVVAKWLPVGIVIAGGIVTLFNQSASKAHVSLPVRKALALDVDVEKHGGKVD